MLFRGRAFRSAKAYRSGTHRSRPPAETYALIEPFLAHAGVTRVADVTGLDVVGMPTTLALRPNALTMACSSGKGMTLDHAYVSGAMEAFELFAAETAVLPSVRASHREISRMHACPDPSDLPLSRHSVFTPDWPLHWHLGWDLVTQAEVAVPLAAVGMQRNKTLINSAGAFHVTSNGLGAGNTFLEAVTAGLYEVVERDAFACHYYAGLHRDHQSPIVPDETLRQLPMVAEVLDRCDAADVRVIVYDCAVDTRVPTYYALAYDGTDRGVGVVRGSGSHFDPEVAILRSVTEALQARLNFIAGSRDDIFRTAFFRSRTSWRATVEASDRARAENPRAAVPGPSAANTFEEDVNRLVRLVTGAGIRHVVVVDLTPDGFPVHIVRVLTPGLENYMNDGYRPGRRAQAFEPMDLPA